MDLKSAAGDIVSLGGELRIEEEWAAVEFVNSSIGNGNSSLGNGRS
jgi:hypothetical protein